MNAPVNPFFSVVIPTFNRATFIGATLDSVLSQTFSAFEILVVDDGSKDNTAEVVGRFSDPRLRYYPKENGERGVARNYGFARAKGHYVLFLDSDDRFHPTHLATLHSKIQELGQPNFIATKYNFDREGVIVPSDMAALPEGWYGLDAFVKGNFLACNICVRRQNSHLHLFEEDRRYAAVEDWMFMLENTQQDRVYIVDAVTLTMNDHDQRSMRADNQGLIRRLDLAADWMQQRLRLTPEQVRQLLGRVYYLCAIHAYADGHRRQAIDYARRAARGLSLKDGAILFLRSLVGVELVSFIRKNVLFQRSV
jgi:GalNAc5-diNAcBac-PP-undecaprenol beta-1,3-glucosyltransferase